jgi:hypothetical protein
VIPSLSCDSLWWQAMMGQLKQDQGRFYTITTRGYYFREGQRALSLCSRHRAGEEALPDYGVNPPVAVDHLRDAEVDRDRHQ